ncbi:MAG: histidine kinase [Saprospiraceae bacterium]|nr:histidine kinase [Saprospiraceae bacterium]
MMKRRILLHLAFWLAYALYDGYLAAPMSGSSFSSLSFWERLQLAYTAELLLLTFKIPAVYLVLYVLVPRYFRNKKLFAFFGSLAITAMIVTVINQTVWYKIIYPIIYGVSSPEPSANFAHALFRLLWSLVDVLMLLGITTALKFFRLRLQAADRERQLVEEKLQSELSFLRAQTNPHFLFNTLNNLYHLARKRSEDTPDAILKLSDLLRFMLYECTTPRIRISQEMKVIRDYLELERLRYGDRLRADFQVEVDDEDQPIAPLLLLPFVENAFKHGASESRGETCVHIFLSAKNGSLDFSVENAKDPNDQEITEGIGLKNVKRQLELIYPEHDLRLDNQGDKFVVGLKIVLNNPITQ